LIRAHYNHCSDRFTSSAKYLHELNTRQQKLNDCYYDKYGNKSDDKREKILLAMDEIVSKVETQVRGNGNIHLPPSSEIEKWYPGKFLGQMMNDKETNFISNSSLPSTNHLPPTSSTYSASSSANKNDESQNQQSAFSRLGAMGANLIGFGNKGSSPNSSNNLSSQSTKSSPNSSNNLSSQTPNELPKDSEEATEKSLSSQISLATIEEVESKLQVLDRSFMKSLYDNNPLEELAGVIYQGYLWMKNTSSNKLAPSWVTTNLIMIIFTCILTYIYIKYNLHIIIIIIYKIQPTYYYYYYYYYYYTFYIYLLKLLLLLFNVHCSF
jgi:hypothetical protein